MLNDLRFAARFLRKHPGFTAAALIILALGIGANTAIFTVVNAVLLRSLPYHDPDRLTILYEQRAREGMLRNVVSNADFLDWRARNHSFTGVAAVATGVVTVTGETGPERVGAGVVSAGFFETLGVRIALGRGIVTEDEDPGKSRVVVLGPALWKRRFGGDPQVVGRSMTLQGAAFTIVGVLPDSFRYPDPSLDLWLPLAFGPTTAKDRANHTLSVFARLKPGVSLASARADFDVLGAQLEKEYPDINRGHRPAIFDARDELVGPVQPTLVALFGAVAFVLLIACGNVASLLLARAESRRQEMAVRRALGASRMRIVGQFLTESALLAFIAGGLGLALAVWGVEALKLAIPPQLVVMGMDDIKVDMPVLLFSFVVCLGTGLLFGLAPALTSARANIDSGLKAGARNVGAAAGRKWLRNALVVSEVALSLVLLAGAGLMIRSVARLQDVSPGFRAENVLTMQLALSPAKYRAGQQSEAFFNQLLDRLRGLEGVKAAGAALSLPVSGQDGRRGIAVEGRVAPNNEPTRAHFRVVTPGYFEAMGIALRKGRYLEARDSADGQPVVVINETAARRYWPDLDPVGRRLRIGGTEEMRVIVGIVSDVKHWGLDQAVNPETYIPLSQMPLYNSLNIVMRTAGNPADLVGAVRAQVQSLDSDQPLSRIRTMEEVLAASMELRRFCMQLLGLFASIAILLAAAGAYGVMTYTVSARTRELGLRMAMGAQRAHILTMVLRQGMLPVALGVAFGLGGAYGLTRYLGKLLFSTDPADPLTFTAVAFVLALVGAIAAYVPARRATRIDPLIALRYE